MMHRALTDNSQSITSWLRMPSDPVPHGTNHLPRDHACDRLIQKADFLPDRKLV